MHGEIVVVARSEGLNATRAVQWRHQEVTCPKLRRQLPKRASNSARRVWRKTFKCPSDSLEALAIWRRGSLFWWRYMSAERGILFGVLTRRSAAPFSLASIQRRVRLSPPPGVDSPYVAGG